MNSRPTVIPEDQWRNAVQFWASTAGRARTERNLENRANYEMSHYGGSKSFARLRREMTKDGKEPDKLELFEANHKPKRPKTKLDDASAAALDKIRAKLDGLPESSRSDTAMQDKIYEEIVGEDKNGYAKTYGLNVKVSRSHEKKCAVANEREKKIKAEEDLKNMRLKLQETEEKVEMAQHKAERAVDGVGRVMGDILLLKSQLRRGEYGSIEDEEADRSFWQEFEKDFPSYERGSPSGEDELVSNDEDA